MSFTYRVIIQEATPSLTISGTYIWIKPSTGTASVRLNDWIQFAAGDVISSYTEDLYTRTMEVSASEPIASLGLMWLNTDTNSTMIYLSAWIPFVGG
jgi:hypothetical protein